MEAGEHDDFMEENMPDFDEYDEIDYIDCCEDDDDEVDITDLQERNTCQKPVSRAHRPPNSVGSAAASSGKIQTPAKPRRNSDAGDLRLGVKSEIMKPAVVEHAETHQCPVCGKTLETDNQGLNAHVDFCLSRGAILEAQVEASHAPAAPKKFTGWPKPESVKKDETQKATRNKGKPTSKRGK